MPVKAAGLPRFPAETSTADMAAGLAGRPTGDLSPPPRAAPALPPSLGGSRLAPAGGAGAGPAEGRGGRAQRRGSACHRTGGSAASAVSMATRFPRGARQPRQGAVRRHVGSGGRGPAMPGVAP